MVFHQGFCCMESVESSMAWSLTQKACSYVTTASGAELDHDWAKVAGDSVLAYLHRQLENLVQGTQVQLRLEERTPSNIKDWSNTKHTKLMQITKWCQQGDIFKNLPNETSITQCSVHTVSLHWQLTKSWRKHNFHFYFPWRFYDLGWKVGLIYSNKLTKYNSMQAVVEQSSQILLK